MEFLCLGIVKKKNEKDFCSCSFEKFELFFIYAEFYTKNYETIFLSQLHVRSTCPEMLLMELPILQGSGHVFLCSTLNSVLLMLEHGCPNASTPKNAFSLTPFFSNSI